VTVMIADRHEKRHLEGIRDTGQRAGNLFSHAGRIPLPVVGVLAADQIPVWQTSASGGCTVFRDAAIARSVCSRSNAGREK
jgi:hypothetical protein